MKAFDKWWENVENMSVVRPQEIWKAALEWVKREAISLDERGDISRTVIDRELNNE